MNLKVILPYVFVGTIILGAIGAVCFLLFQ